MLRQTFDLTPDGRVSLTAYLQDYSPQMPLWTRRPAVVVLPGGGYTFLSEREADPIAFSFLAAGFHVLVLRYSLREQTVFPQPLADAAQALRLIRAQADAWQLDPDRIAICGFSAGGHLAATLGTLWNHPVLTAHLGGPAEDFRPNALILGYPVISASHYGPISLFGPMIGCGDAETVLDLLSCERHVGAHTPPAFLFHTFQDSLVAVENSLIFAQAMAAANRPFEIHVFTPGSHGLSLADERTSNGYLATIEPRVTPWFDLAVSWLNRIFGQPLTTAAGPNPPSAERARWQVGPPTDPGRRPAQPIPLHITSRLADVLADPAGQAILARRLGRLLDSPLIRTVSHLTLQQVAQYTGGQVTADMLAAIEADLSALAAAAGADSPGRADR